MARLKIDKFLDNILSKNWALTIFLSFSVLLCVKNQ